MPIATKFKAPMLLPLPLGRGSWGVARSATGGIFPQENKGNRPGFILTSYLARSIPRVSGDSVSSSPVGAER